MKTLLCLITFGICQFSFSQNDSICPNSEAYFCVKVTTYIDLTNTYYHGREEFQFVNDNLSEDTLSVLYNGDTIATLALDGDKVFIKRTSTPFNPGYLGFDPDFGTDYEILYDYGLNIGDSVPPNSSWWGNNFIQAIDTVIVQGVQKKRLYLTNGDIWIEGMGSIHHPLHPKMYVFEVVYNLCLAEMEYFGNSPIDSETYIGTCDCATIGLDELDQINPVEIFPNPSNQDFVKVLSESEILEIRVTDMKGEAQVAFFDDQNKSLDISELKNGIYFVVLSTTVGVQRRKLVVAK